MERVGTLINRLKEQFDQQEPADQLAYTAQLLLAELQPRQQVIPRSNVSVVMPAGLVQQQVEESFPIPQKPAVVEMPAPINPLFDMAGEIPTLAHQDFIPAPVEPVILQKPVEANKVLASDAGSLNERFREERVEVATALQGTPIRDLKKGIGINDRFLFVQDLFRGDENMYERSLKTINGFTIYPEAEYWIQRELKVKLSWPDNSETVQLFDQLVKRRFS